MLGIRNFKLPKNCMVCPFCRSLSAYSEENWCVAFEGGKNIDIADINNKKRPDFCPLIEINDK